MNLYMVSAVLSVLFFAGGSISQNRTDVPWMTPIASWDGGGTDATQFKDPQALSISPAGLLYVSDTGNHRILCLDASGAFIGEIGGFGWGLQQFNNPLGIHAQNGLDVLIADNLNHRIERYDKDLHYLATLKSGEEWNTRIRFGFPRDVALSTQGELFCIDGENQRILKLDVLGSPQTSFGDFDAGIGRLLEPQRLLIWKDKLIVSDANPGRIVVFDLYGNCLFHMGEGNLISPRGMAVMEDRYLVIADSKAASLVVLDLNGRFLTRLDHDPARRFDFIEPVDVAFWKGKVYVLDRKRGTIDLFLFRSPSEPGFN